MRIPLLQYTLDLLFPPQCLHCRRRVASSLYPLCGQCERQVPIFASLFCGKCGARLPEARRVCHSAFPYLLAAATPYHHPVVTSLIHALKFAPTRHAARPLSNFLVRYLAALPFSFQSYTIIPLPLAPARRRARGYNQAEELAAHLANALGIPVAADILVKLKDTPPQATLRGREARAANVRGCFALARTSGIPRKVLLLDDVATSGATLREAATVLKREGGVRTVLAVTAAHSG